MRSPHVLGPLSRSRRSRTDLAAQQAWLESLLQLSDAQPDWSNDVFVTSFCEEPDLLSQWRGYAAGGFAIGFAAEALATLADASGSVRLVRVDYGREAARPRLRQLFEQIVAGEPYPLDRRQEIARRMLLPEMARVKDPSFAEEKEWRLLIVADEPQHVRFRAVAQRVIPFVELDLPEPSPVREIVLGPASNQDLRRRGVQQLLARRGYRGVEVRASTSPLRA